MGAHITISEASARSGVSAKMIRHYEQIGLIDPPVRGENNYRFYDPRLIHELGFIHRSRDLGFSIADIRALLSLWRDRKRPSAEVKAIALAHIAELDEKAAALQAMSRQLRHLAANCHGDDKPDCPILDNLAAVQSSVQSRK
ncbi:MAG: Cu(I)-responsive transcriptional regulator [Acidiphilium sp.]|jgi:Cu(I)-responsive transcriptional regulator|uniref:Cu(I)-responsive transcriptional regulator n=1 Tax=Acidiphilium acidophilum TaxID=76588 RepID=A0AAW9DL57_ACIAO|nr:Cu(I)-responsive transcriptional regulator [Acidiphilium acidophilum]MDD2861266.1 Cu(I)-responsive transcriptional regulator [Acidiphilium sp.]MDX5929864.1 Cu(I)-responsive transcriptional regulator [Acidiphilium acidophilum]GBQ19823.1 transcriptional regulator [Acidiphilium acidophilum DSM 700]